MHDSDEQRVLRWALVGRLDEAGLQPYADLDISHAAVSRNVFETPLAAGPGGLLEVESAQPDGTLRTRVRRDARLSDGTAIEPTMIAEAIGASRWLSPLATVSSSGDGVTFRPRGAPFDLEALLRDGRVRFGVERDGRWIGSGAYRVQACRDGEVELEANPHSPRRVNIGRVRCMGYSGADALQRIGTDLSAGQIDLTEVLGREELAGVRGCRKVFGHGRSTAMLWFNTKRIGRPARRELARSLDRIRLLSRTYANPLAFVARSVLPPSMSRVRMSDAREGTESASLQDVATLRMVVIWARRPYLPNPRAWAADIAAQFADIGVAVEVVHTTSPEDYQRQLESGDHDLVLGGWNAFSSSPTEFFDALLHSTMTPAGVATTGCNFAWVRDAKVDAMLQAFRSSPSRQHEQALVDYLDAEVPVVPLGYGVKALCAVWDVDGIGPGDAFTIDLAQLRWDVALKADTG